jgi:hypothetical protein
MNARIFPTERFKWFPAEVAISIGEIFGESTVFFLGFSDGYFISASNLIFGEIVQKLREFSPLLSYRVAQFSDAPY